MIADQERARLVEERLASDRLRNQLEEDRAALEETRQQNLEELAARERLLQEAEKESKAQRAALDESRMKEAEGLKAFFESQRAEAEEMRLNLEKEKEEIELLRQRHAAETEEEIRAIEEKRELLRAEQAELERRSEELEKRGIIQEDAQDVEPETENDPDSPFSQLFDGTLEPGAADVTHGETDETAEEDRTDTDIYNVIDIFPPSVTETEPETSDSDEVKSLTENEETAEPETEEPAADETFTEAEGAEEPETEEPAAEEKLTEVEEKAEPETEEPAAEDTFTDVEETAEFETEEPAAEETFTEAEEVSEPETEEPAAEETFTEVEEASEPETEEAAAEETFTEVEEEAEPETEEPAAEETLTEVEEESEPETEETSADDTAIEPEGTEPGTEEPAADEDFTEAEEAAEHEEDQTVALTADTDLDDALESFKLIDSDADFFGEETESSEQSFSDLMDQFTAQLDLSGLLEPFDETDELDVSDFTIIDDTVPADKVTPITEEPAEADVSAGEAAETENGELPETTEEADDTERLSEPADTVPEEDTTEEAYMSADSEPDMPEGRTGSDDVQENPETDSFDFDAAVDGLAAAVLTNDSWLYNENNLAQLGEEILKVNGLTSKYYVNETDCSYPSFKEVTLGFPVGSCTAVISSVPFCAYAFVRAIARPEEIADGTVMLGSRKLTRDDILYIGSDRLIDKKSRTVDWLTGMTGEKKANILPVLEKLGMEDLGGLELESLSYSQRMLVLLAAVSFSSTPVILINDPQFEIEEVDVTSACGAFRLLADAGKTVIVAGHSPRLLRSVANRVLAIHYGNPVFGGSYQSFIEDNRSALVLFHSDQAEEIKAKLSEDERFTVETDRDIVEIRRAEDSTAGEQDAIDAAIAAGVPVEDLRNGDKGFSIAYKEVFKATPKI